MGFSIRHFYVILFVKGLETFLAAPALRVRMLYDMVHEKHTDTSYYVCALEVRPTVWVDV